MSKIRPLEKEIEAELIRRVQEELGGVSLKTHVRHWPDHVFFLPQGQHFFTELKKPKTGKLAKGQIAAIRELKLLGHRVYIVWDEDDIADVIRFEQAYLAPRSKCPECEAGIAHFCKYATPRGPEYWGSARSTE